MNFWFRNSTDQTVILHFDQLEIVFTSNPDTALLLDPLLQHCIAANSAPPELPNVSIMLAHSTVANDPRNQ